MRSYRNRREFVGGGAARRGCEATATHSDGHGDLQHRRASPDRREQPSNPKRVLFRRIPPATAKPPARRCRSRWRRSHRSGCSPGVNIKNGVQLAVDQHNAANPLPCPAEDFDTEGIRRRRPRSLRRSSTTHRFSTGRSGVLGETKGHRGHLQSGRAGRGHRIGDQRHPLRGGVEDLLPWPGE